MSQSSHTAFITGASSGIGAIYAERLAARGYDLILAARREDRLQTLAGQLQARYAIRASIVKADLSEEQGIEAVEQHLQHDPAIDLFINNAGTAKMAGFLASTPREHQAIHTLNTTALLRLSYAALAAFAPRGRGTLINIASILALHTLPGSAVYSASKAWVLSFTRGLQDEFADSGVRIQAVLPAATATDLWPTSGVALDALPTGTVMTTEDLVDAALRGLEMGEKVTLPPVHDLGLWEAFEQTRLALFTSARTGNRRRDIANSLRQWNRRQGTDRLVLTAAAIGDHHLIARFFTFTRFQDLLHDPLADRLTFIFSLTGEGRQRQRHAQQAEGFLIHVLLSDHSNSRSA